MRSFAHKKWIKLKNELTSWTKKKLLNVWRIEIAENTCSLSLSHSLEHSLCLFNRSTCFWHCNHHLLVPSHLLLRRRWTSCSYFCEGIFKAVFMSREMEGNYTLWDFMRRWEWNWNFTSCCALFHSDNGKVYYNINFW